MQCVIKQRPLVLMYVNALMKQRVSPQEEPYRCLQEGAWWLHSDEQMLCRDKDKSTESSDDVNCPKKRLKVSQQINKA